MSWNAASSVGDALDPIKNGVRTLDQQKDSSPRQYKKELRGPFKRHLFSRCRCHCDYHVHGVSKDFKQRTNSMDRTSREPHECNSIRTFHTSTSLFGNNTTTSTGNSITATPLNAEEFQAKLLSHIPSMAQTLLSDGYYTTTDLLPMSTIATLRNQSTSLRFEHNRFEASYSETIDESTGRVKEQFDKEGVYACEPDGGDYYEATDLITYMSLLLQTLPASLKTEWGTIQTIDPPALSSESFNAKLAVTEHGGAKYPLHVDNPQGIAAGDTRKLTCILYLNPGHEEADGGEIRLFLPATAGAEESWQTLDLSPIGGRLLVFWSDEIPHEVLPTSSLESPTCEKHEKDRYALTIWIPTSDATCLHNASSKFHNLKDMVFEAKNDSDGQ